MQNDWCRHASLLVLAALMSSCGGEGGGAPAEPPVSADPPVSVDPPVPAPPPPVPAPRIVEQPQAQTVAPGNTATFQASAEAMATQGAALRYQWLHNGVTIAGATAASYAIPNVVCANSGEVYSVEVHNGGNVAYSQPAQLVIAPCRVRVLAGATLLPDLGHVDGPGERVALSNPGRVALMPDGRMLFVENETVLRALGTDGVVRTIAGGPGGTFDPFGAIVDTPAAQLRIGIEGLAVDAQGRIYLADSARQVIRRLDADGMVRVFAGLPSTRVPARPRTTVDGPGVQATFNGPGPMTFDNEGNLYVLERGLGDPNTESTPLGRIGGGAIRKIAPDGTVSTLGNLIERIYGRLTAVPGGFQYPPGFARDGAGNFYFSTTQSNSVFKLAADGSFSSFAGSGARAGFVDAQGTAARFNWPGELSVDRAGNVYVADQMGSVVRRIAPDGTTTTLAGSASATGLAQGAGALARFGFIQGLASDAAGNLVVSDLGLGAAQQLRRISRDRPAWRAYETGRRTCRS